MAVKYPGAFAGESSKVVRRTCTIARQRAHNYWQYHNIINIHHVATSCCLAANSLGTNKVRFFSDTFTRSVQRQERKETTHQKLPTATRCDICVKRALHRRYDKKQLLGDIFRMKRKLKRMQPCPSTQALARRRFKHKETATAEKAQTDPQQE